ncbi:MAG: cytochrome c oxidase subunit II [Chloroflexota bacterium]
MTRSQALAHGIQKNLHMTLRRTFRLARLRTAVLLVLALVPLALAACTPENPQSTFDADGPIAELQANLFIYIFWLAVVVFVVVEGALIYSILRFRSRRNADLPAQTHGNTRLEVIWTLIPVVILVAIAIPTLEGIYETDSPASADENTTMTVDIYGHQWWWEAAYPGEAVVTANEIHIPTDTWVDFRLHSDDVIHSFWVPKLGGKVDVIPDDDNRVPLKADEPGVYYGQCAEFCGVAHANMRFRVVAQPREEFQDWLAEHRRPPKPIQDNPDATDGRQLFQQNCATCHSMNLGRIGDVSEERDLQESRQSAFESQREASLLFPGPNLTYLSQRSTLGAGLVEMNRENLISWIADPDEIKVETRMKELAEPYRNNSLSREDATKIAEYLLAMEPQEPGEEPTNGGQNGSPEERGETVFAENCSQCHSTGTDDRVGPGLGDLFEEHDEAYVRESILDPNAEIAEGFDSPSAMPGNFEQQLSDQELDDLIEYLRTL